MNPFELEVKRQELIGFISQCTSSRQKLFLYKDFFQLILSTPQRGIADTYILEFIDDYCSCVNDFSPLYINPEFSEQILQQAADLTARLKLTPAYEQLSRLKKEFDKKLVRYKYLLEKNIEAFEPAKKLTFPVIETQIVSGVCLGLLETLSIKITKATVKDKFIIIPSDKLIESKLESQVKNSWHTAVNFIRQQVRRINTYHEVIIYFNNKNGDYQGNSLGIALTTGFVEALLKYYNAPYLVQIRNNIASTGGMDQHGKILSVSDEVICKKVETVMYSNTSMFVVPSADLPAAERKLTDLKKLYPNRYLRLIGITDFDDLINRRNLINIQKQNPVYRMAKLALNNRITTALITVILLFIVYSFLIVSDDNPAILVPESSIIYVKNKYGDILWTKPYSLGKQDFDPSAYNHLFRITDLNDDGINEVLFCNEPAAALKDPARIGRIVCLNNRGEEMWDYMFTDTISSPREVMTPSYSITILDVANISNKKELLLIACNGPSYSSAIFKLDPATGRRLPGTLWHSGFIVQGALTDIDHDGREDIVAGAINNAYERSGLFGVKIKEWNSQLPANEEYSFYNKPVEELFFYTLVPNSDYLKYQKFRNNGIGFGSVGDLKKEHSYVFFTHEGPLGEDGITYKLNYNRKDFEIVVGNNFRVRRDSLVAKGILSPPLTDTKEYFDLIRSQILYWNGTDLTPRPPGVGKLGS